MIFARNVYDIMMAWIEQSLGLETALQALHMFGFDVGEGCGFALCFALVEGQGFVLERGDFLSTLHGQQSVMTLLCIEQFVVYGSHNLIVL